MKKLRTPTRKTLSNDPFEGLAADIDATIPFENSVSVKYATTISPDSIIRISNARNTFITLDDYRQTPWPPLDTPSADLRSALESIVKKMPYFANLQTDNQEENFFNFLIDIHALALSISQDHQIQPVVLEKNPDNPTQARLIAGERRTISAIYSRGVISELTAEVWNVPLTPLSRAKIKDKENTLHRSLTPYETVISKLAIYNALESPEDLKLEELANHFGYKSLSTPSILNRIFSSESRDEIINQIATKDLSFAEIAKLVPEKQTNKGRPKVTPQPTFAHAKSSGFNFKGKSDTNLITLLITEALKSETFPAQVASYLSNADLNNPDSLMAALEQSAEFMTTKY